MESNRDEAERCVDLAQHAFESGDRAKAQRLIDKAERLYSGLPKVAELRGLLNKLGESTTDGPRQRSAAASSSRKGSIPGASGSGSAETESKSCGPEYTSEQVDAVKKIKLSKDYYEILGVTKTSTDTDLKKAYRKLALQFHPDKNKAPGSGEAFKAIGNAFAILSDPEKRKQYDMYGSAAATSSGPGRTQRHYENGFGYTRGFESDMTAEELFNMFFGGSGFPSSAMYNGQRRGGRTRYFYTNQGDGQGQQQSEASNVTMALQVLPILFFILVTIISSFFVSDPVYSLGRSQKYNVKKLTAELEVPYFVKESFNQDYQGNLKRLEAVIEEEYIGSLRNECYKQRNYKEHMLWRARNFGDEEMLRQARDMNLPSCDALHSLRQKSRFA